MKVQLLSHTPNPEKVIAQAAKLCYSQTGVDEITKKLTDEEIAKFVSKLISIGHESPLEHVSFTFAIEGISRACSHQLVRHRIASYSQQSQRYVNLDKTFKYITPPSIERHDTFDVYNQAMERIYNAYLLLSNDLKITYINQGMNEKDATKKAIEDARYVLPNACETKIIVTMNIRTLYNLFAHRCCTRAQWEIRELANEMLREVKKVAPIVFMKAGASCKRGPCPEGSMSCKL